MRIESGGPTTALAGGPALSRDHPIWSYLVDLAVRTQAPPPHVERLAAAVLFADVPGFTRLTDRMTSRGPQGAELLTAHLNACFGRLIDLVELFGGEVYRFPGDAMLAVWPHADGVRSASSITHAAHCALAIQDAMRGYRLPDDELLSLRIGIDVGEMLAAHLGGLDGRVEFLLAGEPLARVGLAATQARPGEVVLSPAAAALAGHALRTRVLRTGGARLLGPGGPAPMPVTEQPPVARPLPAPRGYVLPAVLARLDAGQADWLAELRRVTTVFFNIGGIDCAAPEAPGQLQAMVTAAQRTLARYEGSLCQLVMADKGIVLHCPFGLPPYAHEDDALRAALAALELSAALHELGLQASVGIATGQVFCGPIGNARRREYNLMGDVVNLAAHLAVAASDAVYCDAATRQAIRERLECEPLGRAALKGHVQPVEVFRCLRAASPGPGAAPTRPSTLIGRVAERAAIFERLERLRRDGQGGALLIEGEAGMGKSRLIQDLLDQATLLGLRGAASVGDAVEAATPYFAWRGIFLQLLGGSPPLRAEALLPQLGEPVGAVEVGAPGAGEASPRSAWPAAAPGGAPTGRLLPLLRQVIAVDVPENELTTSMTSEARADVTRELLLRLLEQSAQRGPLVVVLDDAQCLDSASWSLARLVVDRVPGLLLVLGTRPLRHEAPAELQLILSEPTAQRLVVSNLSEQESTQLVCQRLGVERVPDTLASVLWDKTEGHPLYLQELALALRDGGALRIEAGRCYVSGSAAELESLGLPPTLQAAITARIDRLTAPQQLTLKVASVIGRQFSLATLQAVFPAPREERLAEDLAALEALQLTQRGTQEPERTDTFAHGVIQEVVYNLMLFAQRQELHRAVAEWYERTYAEDLEPHIPVLAYHWRWAVSSAREAPETALIAIDYLERAGQQAFTSYANLETMQFYEEALRLAAELPEARRSSGVPATRRAVWKQRLGEAYFRIGRLPEAIEQLRAASAELGAPAPRSPLALGLGIVADAGRQLVRRRLPWLFHAETDPVQRQRLEQIAEVYASLSLFTFITLDELASVGALLRGHNLAEQAGPSGVLLRTSYQLADFMALLFTRPALFEEYIERAHAIAAEVRAPASEAQLWFGGKGLYRIVHGRWDEADAATAEAQRLFAELGDRRWTELSIYQRSNIAMLRGDLERSRELTAEALASAERRADAQAQAWLLIQQAHAEVIHGRFEAALGRLDEADRRLAASRVSLADPAALFWSEATRSLALVHAGQRTEALAAAEAAAARIKPYLNFMYYAIRGFGNLAEASLALWQAAPTDARARNVARKSVRAAQQFARSSPFGRPQALLWEGLYAYADGARERAIRAWQTAAASAEELQMPYDEGLAHAFLGRYLDTSLAERRAHLARAHHLLRRLGAAHHLALVQWALDVEASGAD